MGMVYTTRRISLVIAILFTVVLVNVNAAENNDSTASTSEKADDAKTSFEFPEQHWGSYYDPENIFCGKYDCYKILGFDYESWGRSPPSKKDLTQSYRTMSKRWHPDKNRDKGANDRFMKINKAYKVLTTRKLRKEYDYLRQHPMEYFSKYGSVMYSYKPKTDTIFVVILLLLVGSAFTWYAQKNRWQQIADRVVKDAVDGLKAGEGGSTESLELRAKAENMMKIQNDKNTGTNGQLDASWSKKQGKGKMKLTKKEVRQKENDELRPFIEELVKDIQDFGAGFHQPTWKDLLVVRMIKWPVHIGQELVWIVKYYLRRLRGLELNDVEKEVLTSRAVGPVAWETSSQKDKDEMIEMKLWKMDNFEEWCELQEIKQLNSKEQKAYGRMKKKALKSKANKGD